jgi:beta-fructofuranosidase
MSVISRESPKDLRNGSLSNEPLMQFAFAGIFDHGCLYACNSFWDPVSGQRVVFGWITEEDLSDNLRHRQNWSGLISLPRITRLTTMHKVKRARSTCDLGCITSIEATSDCDGTYTVRTLGIFPDPRLEILRTRAHKTDLPSRTEITLRQSDKVITTFDHDQHEPSLPLTTSRWELKVEIVVGRHCSRVGLAIGHDPDFNWQTILYWDPVQETFYVERPQIAFPITDDMCLGIGEDAASSKQLSRRVNHAPEVAPHTLFTFGSTVAKSRTKVEEIGVEEDEEEEPLRIHAFYDTSVLEIFVNDRTAISTRIFLPDSFPPCTERGSNNYNEHRTDDASTAPTRRCYGIRFFARGSLSPAIDNASKPSIATVNRATVWDGLEVPET